MSKSALFGLSLFVGATLIAIPFAQAECQYDLNGVGYGYNGEDCPYRGGGNAQPWQPSPQALHQQRYSALLERAGKLVDGLSADASSEEALDQRLSELDDRLEPVYAAAWLRWGKANAEMAALGPATKQLEDLSDRYALDLADTVLPKLAQDRADAAALEAARDAEKAALSKISAAGEYYHAFARAQLSDIGRWINVALPRSPQVDELRPQFLPMDIRSDPTPTPMPAYPLPAFALRPDIPAPPTTNFDGAPPARPDMPADIDGKLSMLETRLTETAQAVDGANASEAEVASTMERFRQYADIVHDTYAKLDQAQADDNDALDRAHAAKHELEDASNGVEQESVFLFSDAAREFALEHFRKDVVEPELRRMVSAAYAGRPPHELTDEFVEESWSSQKLHLFSLVQKGETVADAHELVRRTLDMVDNAEAAMSEAARLLATADPAEAQAFAEALGQRLGSDARAIAAEALKTADIPQPYKVFWLKYFVAD